MDKNFSVDYFRNMSHDVFMSTNLNKIEKFKSNVFRFFRQVRGLFPSALPTGMTAFTEWADSIMQTYSLPTQDRDSVHGTLATMIMHLLPGVTSRPKYKFAKDIRATCAKQIAGAAFHELKAKYQKKAAEEAAKAAQENNKLAEVTALHQGGTSQNGLQV